MIGPAVVAAAFAVAASELKVPLDYPTIQKAVDAAKTNDVILIAPGIYTEQVQVISNKLTLIGQPGTILRASEKMVPFIGNPSGAVPILSLWHSEVTVRGLVFEGERLAERFAGPGVGDLEGVFFRQSRGSVENCGFYGFRESKPGPEGAQALVFVNFEENDSEVDFRLTGCTFADNYAGIQIVGSPTRRSIQLTIENNTIIGPGPLENLDYQGIWIREGVAGRITGNTIKGYSYVGTTADFPLGFGILAAHQADPSKFGKLEPLTIEGNAFLDNQVHVALIGGDGSVVRNNRFQGTAPGMIPMGLAVTGERVQISNNQFEDLAEGIRLIGNDPIFGTSLGAAVGAQVMSNRFCHVTRRINVEPLASVTQTGTLNCPFPAPSMAIVPAVLLSWPVEDEGWTVETSASLNGPWSPAEATPFSQSGRQSIALPTDAAYRSFRLVKP